MEMTDDLVTNRTVLSGCTGLERAAVMQVM